VTEPHRDRIVAILAVEEIDGVSIEAMGANVRWITMPQETFDKIMESLNDPTFRARRERPQRDK
jgi:hypothetical protein